MIVIFRVVVFAVLQHFSGLSLAQTANKNENGIRFIFRFRLECFFRHTITLGSGFNIKVDERDT